MYAIKLTELCHNQRFKESQVVSSELVYPKGAVPNAQLIWFRIELTSGERLFITKPLQDFYQYIDLPESSIGGWTDGDRGRDSTGHFTRYALDDSVGSESLSGELQQRTESAEEPVAS
jgi:hypothetical protein